MMCTDDASCGTWVDADSMQDYIKAALDDPGSYNQDQSGVSTLIRVLDETGETGWIDFAAGVDVDGALVALNDARAGMRLDWTHDAGGVLVEPPASWDVGTTDEEIRAFVAAAPARNGGDDSLTDEDRERAADYWITARGAVQSQRELVRAAIEALDLSSMKSYADGPPEYDSEKLDIARDCIGMAGDCERAYGSERANGDAPIFDPIVKMLER